MALIDVECANCGELFGKRKSKVESSNLDFCNRMCMGEYNREYRTCERCGEKFRSTNGERQRHCSRSCAAEATHETRPYSFKLEPHHGYPAWPTPVVSVHQLAVIADGADPYKVFGNDKYNVDHINGCKLDNRPENLSLISAREHGRKDGGRYSTYSHSDVLAAISQLMDSHSPDEVQEAVAAAKR